VTLLPRRETAHPEALAGVAPEGGTLREPSPPARRLLRNTLLAGVSEASQVLLFLLVLLAARLLGPVAFGQYGTAMAFVGLFRVLADLGMPTASTLAASREPGSAARSYGNLLGLQAVLCGLAVAACLLVGRRLYEGVTWLAVVLLCGELVARAAQTTLRWVLRVFGRFGVEAVAMSAERLLTLVLGVAVLLAGGGVPGLVAAFVAVRAANAVGLLAWVRGNVLPLRARADLRAWRGLLRDGLPLAFSGAFLSLVVQLDSVLLERLGGARDVGLYRAPLRITEGLMLAPRAVAAALLPVLPALYSRGARALDAPYRLGTALLLLAGLAVAVPGLGVPGPVVRLVFGPAYEAAIDATPLLLLAVVPAFLAVLGEIVLASVGRARAIPWLTAAALGTNALLVIVLVPRHGLMGASAATLAAVTVHAVLVAVLVRRAGPRAGWASLLLAGSLCGAAGTLAAFFARAWPAPVAVAAGTIVLAASAAVVGLADRGARAEVRALLRREGR
jgi:O-antigen/teichoic acid export membrane protein